MSAVIAAVRSELVKARRRAYLVAAVAAPVAAAAVFSALTISTAQEEALDVPAPGAGTTLADLLPADGIVAGVANAATLVGVITIAAAAVASAQEHTTGMLRNLLVRAPGRTSLLIGKTAVLAGVAAVVGVVCALVGSGAAILAAGARGLDTDAWFTSDGAAAVVRTAGNLGLAAAGYAVIGVALGMLLRSPGASIGIAVAWLLPVEGLLEGAFGDETKYLPGRLLDAVVATTADTAPYAAALVGAALYAMVALGAAARLLRTRDVTA